MKVLLTGAFGNIGIYVLKELIKKGHQVRCFDILTKENKKIAKKFKGKAEIFWGDLRSFSDLTMALTGQEIIIHLAFIIPPKSESHPDFAWQVNVGGTKNLLEAAKINNGCLPKIIFVSSVAVFGKNTNLSSPRLSSDHICPSDYYTLAKILCEYMVKFSGMTWSIFRFGAVLPSIKLKDIADQFKSMFRIPLNTQVEFLHPKDAGLALANAVSSDKIWGKILLIGGGPHCQLYQEEIIKRVLNTLGIGMFPKKSFSKNPYYTHWMDTSESQKLLKYQNHTFDDFIEELTLSLKWKRPLIKLFRPLIRYWILKNYSFAD